MLCRWGGFWLLGHENVCPCTPDLEGGSTAVFAGCLLLACWVALGRSALPGLSFPICK